MHAATGQGFLRLVSTEECDASLTSPAFALDGHTLAVSGYLRASGGDVYLAVDYLDAVGWSDETDRRPAAEQRIAVPPDGRMHQIQQILGGRVISLPHSARAARVRLVLFAPQGTGIGNPAMLDLDTVSVNSFDPIPVH
jgi:hypothetical protein